MALGQPQIQAIKEDIETPEHVAGQFLFRKKIGKAAV